MRSVLCSGVKVWCSEASSGCPWHAQCPQFCCSPVYEARHTWHCPCMNDVYNTSQGSFGNSSWDPHHPVCTCLWEILQQLCIAPFSSAKTSPQRYCCYVTVCLTLAKYYCSLWNPLLSHEMSYSLCIWDCWVTGGYWCCIWTNPYGAWLSVATRMCACATKVPSGCHPGWCVMVEGAVWAALSGEC